MRRKFILIVLFITWISIGAGISLKQKEPRLPIYGITSFDYDYGRLQKSNSDTTERPFTRYWNNLMRNVRLSMPTITWNMTNPLANLFNAGAPNVMETPVSDSFGYVAASSTHKRRSSGKRRKSSKRDKKRKVAQIDAEQGQTEHAEVAPKLQYMLPAYTNRVDPNKAMYFYDPNTNKYFEIHSMRSHGHYVQDNYYFNKDNYYDEENEGNESEGMDFEDSAAHDDDLKKNADSVGSESDSNGYESPEDKLADYESPEDKLADYESPEASDVNSDEEETNPDQKLQSAMKSEESLRNVLGSYMRDDVSSRQRQRAKPKYAAGKINSGKVGPRNKLKYYFLQPY